MGFFSRFSLIFKSKASKALDKYEDPRETLDYSYERQLQLLTQVRRGVVDVASSRKRVEIQLGQLQDSAGRLQSQAQQAVQAGRDDLAREALTRRAAANSQIASLTTQYAQLQHEEEKLTGACSQLQNRIEAFRTRKETIKATYTAAEAQARIGEAFAGVSGEMADVGAAMQRAEDKTQQMQARAGAVDELLASGALDDPSLPAGDSIQRELDALTSTSSVEAELTALKAAPALESGA